METNVQELIQKQSEAVEELRKSIEGKETLSTEKLEKIKADFLAGEKANQKLQQELELQKQSIEEQKTAIEEQKNTIQELEKKMYRVPSHGDSDISKKEAVSSFEKYLLEYPKSG